MRKSRKELKRDLKLYKSDLNSMADEAIYYRKRAEKDEAFIARLIEMGGHMALRHDRWNELVAEWHANPPKNYREAS